MELVKPLLWLCGSRVGAVTGLTRVHVRSERTGLTDSIMVVLNRVLPYTIIIVPDLILRASANTDNVIVINLLLLTSVYLELVFKEFFLLKNNEKNTITEPFFFCIIFENLLFIIIGANYFYWDIQYTTKNWFVNCNIIFDIQCVYLPYADSISGVFVQNESPDAAYTKLTSNVIKSN